MAPRRYRGRAVESDYGRNALDSKQEELQPAIRRGLIDRAGVPADDPWLHPDKSTLFQSLNALIDAALARAGALNSDDQDPLLAMCQKAELTVAEYEAVALKADGFSWSEIGKAQHVSENAARQAGRRGQRKLRQFISNST